MEIKGVRRLQAADQKYPKEIHLCLSVFICGFNTLSINNFSQERLCH